MVVMGKNSFQVKSWQNVLSVKLKNNQDGKIQNESTNAKVETANKQRRWPADLPGTNWGDHAT